jgi:hypothetical protein
MACMTASCLIRSLVGLSRGHSKGYRETSPTYIKRNRPDEPKQFDRTNGLFNVFLRDLADEGFGVDRQWQGIDFMFQQFSVFEYSS